MTKKFTRWTAADAEAVLDELEASGLSVAEFGRRRGLNTKRLYRWRARLRPKEQRQPAPRLVERVAAASPPCGGLRVHCPSGHVIELVDVDVDVSVRNVLAAVAGVSS